MQATADGQHGINVLYVGIEREGAMGADTVVGRQMLHVDGGIDKVPKSGLMNHHALGFACRT